MTGTQFGPDVYVTIGQRPCYGVTSVAGQAATQLTCLLPVGVGVNQIVVVRQVPRDAQRSLVAALPDSVVVLDVRASCTLVVCNCCRIRYL